MLNYFSIPADFKLETVDKIAQLNNKHKNKAKIKEVYGQITVGNLVGSGRANDLLPQVNFSKLQAYVKKLNTYNIDYNYTLNATCLGNREFEYAFIYELKDFLKQLDSLNIAYVTVGLPSIMKIITQESYRFKLKVSTVCQINNAEKALTYKRLGAETIVLDESINRDFGTLRRIRKAFGPQVELIVNVICHKNCIYENFHHNQTSHDSNCNSENKSISFYSHRCMLQRCESCSNLLKLAWIRPEDLFYYNDAGYHIFKIQGRQAAENGDILRTADAYMSGSYDGNLMLLLDCFQPTNSFTVELDNRKLDNYLRPFYTQDQFCKNYCEECQYCDAYMRKYFDCDEINETFSLSAQFYNALENDL